MHKELAVEAREGLFKVVCRNFMGRYEARAIGDRLGLNEIKAPADGPGDNGLKDGEYFAWDVMSHHPELHALVAGERLGDVAEMARDFHMHVTAGKELLPEVAVHEEVHQAGSAVSVIEDRHKSVFQRGPKALLSAFLVRAIPAVVVLFALLVVSRHVGDHSQGVGLSTLFSRAAQPPVEQNRLAWLIDPDHSHKLRFQIRGVKFLDGNRMIFADGHFVRIDGVEELRPLFQEAQKQSVAPELYANVESGKVMVERIMVAGQAFVADGGEMVRLDRFTPASTPPRRSIHANPNMFYQMRELPAFDDGDAIKELVGQRIAVVGSITEEEGRLVLRDEEGIGFALERSSHEGMRQLLGAFTGDPAELQVDLILKSVMPWTDRRNPENSRRDTRLLGNAEVYSASAQSFDVVARR